MRLLLCSSCCSSFCCKNEEKVLFFFSSSSSSSKLQIDQAIYVSAARFQDLIIAQSLARSAREHLRELDNNRDTLARLFSSRRRRRRGEREREGRICARLNTNNPVGLVCPSCRTRLLFTARRHQPCALEQNSRETVAVADVIVETRIR